MHELQQQVDEVILHYGGYWEPLSMLARLGEEVGELSRAMNIKFGGKRSKGPEDGRDIKEEISDILFTCLAIANTEDFDAFEELKLKIKKDWIKCKGIYDT